MIAPPFSRPSAPSVLTLDDVVWQTSRDRVVLSPKRGGRVVSWRHEGSDELVKQPADVMDGGLLRVLLGEERYPGVSYVTPHVVVARDDGPERFRAHLRFSWSAPNALARMFGWPEKVNPCCTEGLLLDKIVSFDPDRSALIVEMRVTNGSDEVRRVTPWLHNHFDGWVHGDHAVLDGREAQYLWHDPYWAGHRADGAAESMRVVVTDRDGARSAVLGASPHGLAGMALYGRNDYGPHSTDACVELRGRTVTLAPGRRWVGNAFLAVGRDWRTWASRSPVELFWHVEDGDPSAAALDESSLLSLLPAWALPREVERGAMVVSPLDKVPFTSDARFDAAHAFAAFHAHEGRADAHVVLFALRDLDNLRATLSAPPAWSRGPLPERVAAGQLVRVAIHAPPDLAGREAVELRLTAGSDELAVLRVSPDAAVEPRFPYQVKQLSTYLDERFRAERCGYFVHQNGTGREESADDFRAWQVRARRRMLRWVRNSVTGPAPLSPRLMERQVGPHCVRDKVLLQTEPGLWLPMYVVYPKDAPPAGRKRPAILFAHGSCAGKLHFAPDETEAMQDPALVGEWPSPYQFAHQLGCVVALPDRRGWGEWAEGNHSQRPERSRAAGYNVLAMEVWDHLRVIDYLYDRPDVDPRCVTSMGSSGGGWMTIFVAGFHRRCSGGIVSSSITTRASIPDQYFFRAPSGGTDTDEAPLHPYASIPMATASICTLVAPRPLWVMDGRHDRGVLPALPHTDAEAENAWRQWHAQTDAGRGEIARAYHLLGADDRFRADWFTGGHLAGFNLPNVADWLARHWNVARRNNPAGDDHHPGIT